MFVYIATVTMVEKWIKMICSVVEFVCVLSYGLQREERQQYFVFVFSYFIFLRQYIISIYIFNSIILIFVNLINIVYIILYIPTLH